MAWNTGNLGGQRAAGANIREDLSNMISNISRDETPFLSAIGTNKAKGRLHEWLTDEYAVPGENKMAEGFTADATRAGTRQTPRSRLDNRTQIFGKDIVSSGSVISSDVAGVANEFAYQLKKAGVELRRDIEFQYVRWSESTTGDVADLVKVAAVGATLGQLGSIYTYVPNWINATSAGVLRLVDGSGSTTGPQAAGANYFDVDAVGERTVQFSAAPTRASVARSHFEDLITQMYRAGGKPNVAFIPVGMRTAVSALFADGSSGSAERRIDAMMKKLNISIMGVSTDFGVDLALVHNYIMDGPSGSTGGAGSGNTILLADTSKAKRSVLTPMMTEEDRIARYGRLALMVCEETLEIQNPNSFGAIVGVQA